jgi:hypothetical protein
MSISQAPYVKLTTGQLTVNPAGVGDTEGLFTVGNNLRPDGKPHNEYRMRVIKNDTPGIGGRLFHESINYVNNVGQTKLYLTYDHLNAKLSTPESALFESNDHNVIGNFNVSSNATILGNLTVGGSISPAQTIFNNAVATNLTVLNTLDLAQNNAQFLKTNALGVVEAGVFSTVSVGSALTANTALTALAVAPLANLTATNIVNTNLTSLSAQVSNLTVNDTAVINGADALVDGFNIAEYTNWTVPTDPSKNKYIVGNYGRITLDPTFGASALVTEPNSVAGSRGRVIASDLASPYCTIAGTRGDYNISGTSQLSNLLPKCAVLGAIMPGASTADGAFVALCDGDSASATANAGYALATNNSNAGAGFNKGIDLRQRQLISGTAVNLAYDDCDIHFNSDAKIKSIGVTTSKKLHLDAVLSHPNATPTLGLNNIVDIDYTLANAQTGGHYVQDLYAKINVNDSFGSTATLGDPNTVQVVRARISGDDPQAQFSNFSAGRFDWNCKGSTMATSNKFIKACVLASVQPQTTTAKNGMVVLLEGDSGVAQCDSAYGVSTCNSTGGTNFNYIFDALNNNTITGTDVPVLPAVADIRLSNGLLLKSVAYAITDGDATALAVGAVVLTSNATGVGKMFISNGSILKQLAFATP